MRQNGQGDPSSPSEDIAVIISKARNKSRISETKQNKICNYEITPIIR